MKAILIFVAALAMSLPLAPASAQDGTFQPPASIKIDLPGDSPISLLGEQSNESRSSARGGALITDLRMALSFRNSSQKRIRAVTLLVLAQDVTPGGKASVSAPGLNVGPGESFPVRIDLRVLRPLTRGNNPTVQVGLDGVLFDDLSFFGPNRLNSRRSLTGWEMEARRDRDYLRELFQAKGPEGLRKELLNGMAAQSNRRPVNVRVVSGRSTVEEPEEQVQFAFLDVPESPVEPVTGLARVAGSEARHPWLEVANRSGRSIRYFEVAWMIREKDGREFLAGVVPSSNTGAAIEPGRHGVAGQDRVLRFSASGGEPVTLGGMTGFVSLVEFGDGSLWVPNRQFLQNPRVRGVVGLSQEEERLVELYKRKGLDAVIQELDVR
jgi:hypothetical protein